MSNKITFGDLILFLEDQIVKPDTVNIFAKRAYSTVIQKIQQTYSLDDLATEFKINNLQLTQNMKYKLYAWLNPGKRDMSRLLKLRSTIQKNGKTDPKSKIELKKALTSIVGIGSVGADQLMADGVASIADLKKIKYYSKLPESAQIFLKFNPERKIPHEHMLKLQPIIIGFRFAPVIMVGSFRRNTAFSRDFDVMIISDNPSIMLDYEFYLSKSFNGKTYRYSSGQDKISFLIEIPKVILGTEVDMVYKFDVFRTPKSQQYAMLLYATGSKMFNIKMRSNAKKMGYLLNQEGLFDIKTKKQIPIKSEKGFFTVLNMPYLEPGDR